MTRSVVSGVLAIVTMVGAVLTAAMPDWIEAVFDVSPDRGSGAVEWIMVGLLAAVSLFLGAYSWRARQVALTRNH